MFDHTYETILADTEPSRVIHRKIRYQVYCLERSFEDPAVFPFGEEYDRWDTHAAQFIVRERGSGKWVAAMRIVLPYAASFPLEALNCLEPTHQKRLRRRRLGEISRVCIIRSSKPQHENTHLNWDFGPVNSNNESEVLLGLTRALIIYGLERSIEHYYLLITGAFARLLRRLGIALDQVGTAIEHRGWRTPYLMDLRSSVKSMCKRSPVVHDMFVRKALAYRPFSALEEDDINSALKRSSFLIAAFQQQSLSQPASGAWRNDPEWSTPSPDTKPNRFRN